MESETQHPSSRLFTIRLWQEELGEGQTEWRGRAQDIATGSAKNFRDWPGLITFLTRPLETADSPCDEPAEHPSA